MKDFELAPELKAQLQAKITELANFCHDNGIPFVGCYAVSKNETGLSRFTSAYLDGSKGLAPDFLRAMCELAKAPSISEGMIKAMMVSGAADSIMEMSEDEAAEVCPCPDCQLARDQEAESAPKIH